MARSGIRAGLAVVGLALALVWLPLGAAGQADPTATAGDTAATVRAKEDALGLLLNRARAREGIEPLARNAALDRAAEEHSRDMAANDYLEHTAPDGTT